MCRHGATWANKPTAPCRIQNCSHGHVSQQICTEIAHSSMLTHTSHNLVHDKSDEAGSSGVILRLSEQPDDATRQPTAPSPSCDVTVGTNNRNPAAAAATALSALQQLQRAGQAPVKVMAEIPLSGPYFDFGQTGLGARGRGGSCSASASSVWGLLRTAATEMPSADLQSAIIDITAGRPHVGRGATLPGTPPVGSAARAECAAGGGMGAAVALSGGAVAVPRVLPSRVPEAAEWVQVRPDPRSSLANLVARPVDLGQVGVGGRQGKGGWGLQATLQL